MLQGSMHLEDHPGLLSNKRREDAKSMHEPKSPIKSQITFPNDTYPHVYIYIIITIITIIIYIYMYIYIYILCIIYIYLPARFNWQLQNIKNCGNDSNR